MTIPSWRDSFQVLAEDMSPKAANLLRAVASLEYAGHVRHKQAEKTIRPALVQVDRDDFSALAGTMMGAAREFEAEGRYEEAATAREIGGMIAATLADVYELEMANVAEAPSEDRQEFLAEAHTLVEEFGPVVEQLLDSEESEAGEHFGRLLDVIRERLAVLDRLEGNR